MVAKSWSIIKILTLVICIEYGQAVTVSPLCPTNKIAPHRRIANWGDDIRQPKTLGAFYDLFSPNGAQYLPSSMQEKPQKDDPNDCGDIEDYDENDLTSLISPQRRQGGYRFFFGGEQNPNLIPSQVSSKPPRPTRPPYYQNMNTGTTSRPHRPQRPGYPASRPPYASGGYFSGNPYRPPPNQYPSKPDHQYHQPVRDKTSRSAHMRLLSAKTEAYSRARDEIKPVHEDNYENDVTYRPVVVGGPVGHVIGVSAARPTIRPEPHTTTRRPINYVSYAMRPNPNYAYPTRQERPRNLNYSNSILGSFLDLLL